MDAIKTYQDLQAATDKAAFIMEAIREHKASEMYQTAVDAEQYDRKRNVTIMKYQKLLYTLSGKAVPDNYSANYKIVSGFFNRFVTQEAQYLLGNGLTLEKSSNKAKLGKDIDQRLQSAARSALVQGVAFGFWNLDHLEVFKFTAFVPLRDEMDGTLKAGIRFTQISTDRPIRATLYELDGYTKYAEKKTGKLEIEKEKRSYKIARTGSQYDGETVQDGGNYPGFPIIPLWANPHHQSELVGLREGIDCYDLVKSGFANDLDDASQIYWTLQNCGGMDDDLSLAQFVERMKTIKAAVVGNGDDGVKAEAHTIEVPYAAREAMLDRLQNDLYKDAQMLDVEKLSAAQKTATEINAAYQPMDNKVDQFEYCVIDFLQGVFAVAGIEDNPSFKRSKIVNMREQTEMVLMAAEYLDDETLLSKLPWLTPEEVKAIMKRKAQEGVDRFRQNAAPGGDYGQEAGAQQAQDGGAVTEDAEK